MRNLFGNNIPQNTREVGKATNSNNGGISAKVLCLMTGLAAISSSGIGIASAEDNANVTDFDLITETILNNNVVQVTSPDGVTWDTIVPDTIRVQLNGQMKFRWRNGRIERGAVYLGKCPSNDLLRCSNHPRIAFEHRDYPDMYDDIWYKKKSKVWKFNHEATFSTSQLLTSVPGFNPDLYLGTQILEACNQRAESGERSFTLKTKMTVSVNTVTGDADFVQANPPPIEEVEFIGGDQTKSVDFDLNVICDTLTHAKQPKTTTNQDLNFDQGPLKVTDIKMSLTTYSNAYTEPTPGTQCKKAKLRVTLETNQEGLVPFKLWTQLNDWEVTNEDVIVGAHHQDGKFIAVHERWIEINKNTVVQFKARDLVNETFYNETNWKEITLHCSNPGGGGLASPDSDDDQNVPVGATLEGGFEFIDNSNAAKKKQCERTAKVLVWFDAPKNDNIHYSLDCGALGNFSGVLQPASISAGKYRAAKLVNFQVTKTIEAGCTLRTVSPGSPKDHAFKSKTFQCVKSAGNSSGIDDIATPIRPQTGSSGSATQPKIKTAPVRTDSEQPKPKIAVCKGGKIKNNKCHCPANAKRKKISRFEYVCKKQKVVAPVKPKKKEPVRVNPPEPKKAKLVCVGGKIRSNKCKCGPNKLRKKLGKQKFQCLAVAKPVKPKKPARANPKPKEKALICKGGKVRNNKCACPKGRILKKQGKRKFLCFRPAG